MLRALEAETQEFLTSALGHVIHLTDEVTDSWRGASNLAVIMLTPT